MINTFLYLCTKFLIYYIYDCAFISCKINVLNKKKYNIINIKKREKKLRMIYIYIYIYFSLLLKFFSGELIFHLNT